MTRTQMNGAELKMRLDGLGLQPSWFGAQLGKSMRTVVRWFDGYAVPPEVATLVEKLSEQTVKEMLKMIENIDDGDDPVVLKTYRTDKEFRSKWPASWHRALTFRVWEHLRAQGRSVTVSYR